MSIDFSFIMSYKSKGSNAERELIHAFWKKQYAAFRSAGSGSNAYPCPDIIAGNNIRKFAIECKSTKSIKQYLTRKEVTELITFGKIFGAQVWFAIRFDRLQWFFLTPDDLDETEGENFVVSIELAKRKGLSFEELVTF